MTARASGTRLRLPCLLAAAALIAAQPVAALSLQFARPPGLVHTDRPPEGAEPQHPLLRASASEHAPAAAVPAARARPWWGWILLGRLHPLIVHFPIALLTVAAMIELLHLVRRRPVPSEAATYCLGFGVVGALVAVCLGTLNAANQSVTGEAAAALERHQVMGWISMIAATSAFATGQLARRARQFRTVVVYVGLVLATGAVVGATGHLGAGLVYGEDYLTGVLPWNQPPAVRVASPVAAVPPSASAAASAPAVGAAAVASTTAAATGAVPASHAAPRPTRHAAPGAAGHEPAPAPEPAAPAVAAQAADAVDFTRDVMPILKHTCVECHGPDKVKARLRMDSVEGLQKGGKSGPLVKPGDPENSLMMRRVLGLDGDDQMPLDKDPLTEQQIDTLRRWIAAGANYPAAGSQ